MIFVCTYYIVNCCFFVVTFSVFKIYLNEIIDLLTTVISHYDMYYNYGNKEQFAKARKCLKINDEKLFK